MATVRLDRAHTCCFSGHRPEKLEETFGKKGWSQQLRPLLQVMIDQALADGYDTFLCGMARGIDLMAADYVLELKATHPALRLIGAIPWRGQAERWQEEERAHYKELLARLDGMYLASETYTRGCPLVRNRWMVDHSSRLIAVYGGTSGGTRTTIEYARRSGLETAVLSLAGHIEG